ncbi:class I fructose-bisphosphate aldolase [Sediminispirochaeta smaragdinae]|uniref:Deoxyribose-phosphate aldolase/phospho-2-dehydro-3-deoxyheptonate aldolase n=1 Tax=Sediminispirochaeta smaragdinae (strain DSM 11293 / JCM 15392 / SEBR 4228) TaxID=573413 RepID=E1R8T6_SEDSS|nr:deoxyribose-phosphate aldolase [Sediminispirochaeta smaragdinae]ADK81843.1 deoxyribose-phosphate aldolase/phospho-2-dehydro-3-deoxyheptonate aldolase [Sediminispirochaeta smaragdinae DSM 11293]
MDKTRRMRQIFRKDGKSLIVAMDHGSNAGAVKGLKQPAKVIEAVVAGGADAIIANMGFAKRFASEMADVGFIARMDVSPTMIGKGHASHLVYEVEYALRLGADAVIVNGGPGIGVEEETLPNIAAVVDACDALGMPVVGEMSPGGFDSDPELKTIDNIVLGARIAAELGVDFVKTVYRPGFEKVIEGCFCPVVVLGGAKTNDTKSFLASIVDAVSQGGAGVAIGRNVWGNAKPAAMAKALSAIIHEHANTEAAWDIYQSQQW